MTEPEPQLGREYFEGVFRHGEDPWSYSSEYETRKYEQTLSLLPPALGSHVLEIGCAEGAFTCDLAGRVRTLTAVDIAEAALERARRRCAGLGNVSFTRLDLFDDALPGTFDGVVCSELLYFGGSAERVLAAGSKITAALRDGGWLVAAHAHVLVDDPASPGFDWAVPFGGARLHRILASVAGLVLECEAISDLYRISRFRRSEQEGRSAPQPTSWRVEHGALTPELLQYVRFPSRCEPEGSSQ